MNEMLLSDSSPVDEQRHYSFNFDPMPHESINQNVENNHRLDQEDIFSQAIKILQQEENESLHTDAASDMADSKDSSPT